MANTFTTLKYHLIFSTKNRRPSIQPTIAPELHKYIVGIIANHKGHAIEVGGVEDHVHILTTIHPTIAVADMIRLIKSNSSKWFHETHGKDFTWQTGYAAFTVSQSNEDEVRTYIQGQQEHHKRVTFRDEYLLFLKRHNIEFDLKYVFDGEFHG